MDLVRNLLCRHLRSCSRIEEGKCLFLFLFSMHYYFSYFLRSFSLLLYASCQLQFIYLYDSLSFLFNIICLCLYHGVILLTQISNIKNLYKFHGKYFENKFLQIYIRIIFTLFTTNFLQYYNYL
jgi:hypothetical protein